MNNELKVGDRVRVSRRIGKNGPSKLVEGEIIRLSQILRIEGEQTALVKYDDGVEPYAHKLSSIELIENHK